MEKISSNGLNFIKIDASSGYSVRTSIIKRQVMKCGKNLRKG